MKLVQWIRFTWDMASFVPVTDAIEPHYQIRVATKDEEKTVFNVISSAFSIDMEWSDTFDQVRDHFESEIEKFFARKEPSCLVLTHGSRIIGASAVDLSADTENHILTGPSILNEYRNRGFGSALLYRSLLMVKEEGFEKAYGITKYNVSAAKFIYTKFNSESNPHNFEPQSVRL